MTTTITPYSVYENYMVSIEDSSYATITSNNSNAKYKFHVYNKLVPIGSNKINISIAVKCSRSPQESPVYLKIYNFKDGIWETLKTETSAIGDSPFTLSTLIEENLSDYYNRNNKIICMVVQNTL